MDGKRNPKPARPDNYLPETIIQHIDLTQVERLEDSFVDTELKEHRSDLLFRVKLKNKQEAFVYILLEHKSSPDKWVAFQLLRYLVRIWEKFQRLGNNKLPLVLPIVFYHGKRKWKVSKQFSALFDLDKKQAEFAEFLPKFSYHLCDLNEFADEELRGKPSLLSVIRLLKHIFQSDLKEKLAETFQPLTDNLTDQFVFERLKVMMLYLLYTGKATEKEIAEAYQQAKGDSKMENFIDHAINQGLQQGLQQGMLQGLEKGRQETTINLVSNGSKLK